MDDENGVLFKLVKKDDAETTVDFYFDLRVYHASEGDEEYEGDNCPSGAYIFKPAADSQESHVYSNMVYIARHDGGFVNEYHMLFQHKYDKQNRAFVKVRTY